MANKTNKAQSIQSYAPFATASIKYPSVPVLSPGPGAYKIEEIHKKKNFLQIPTAFGSKQSRLTFKQSPIFPGPGSYSTSPTWIKPVFMPLKRKKIEYHSVPTFPSTSAGYDESNITSPTYYIKTPRKSSSHKETTFTKTLRKVFVNLGDNIVGPGAYNISFSNKNKGISFPKSKKKYLLAKNICPKSYYNEKYFSSFAVKSIPREFQNFGNRCERKAFEVKDCIGPGYYSTNDLRDIKYSYAPFNSTDARFRDISN